MTLEKEKGSLEISESQKLGKGINTYHIHHWEFNLPQHVEMMVFRHDITSAGGDSTINEFIVILIRPDQMKAKCLYIFSFANIAFIFNTSSFSKSAFLPRLRREVCHFLLTNTTGSYHRGAASHSTARV